MLELMLIGKGKPIDLPSLEPFIYFRYKNDYLRRLKAIRWEWNKMGNLFEYANRNDGNESGVRVWRSVVPFTRHHLPAEPHLTLPPGTTSFTDPDAPPGSAYFYMLELFRPGYASQFTELLTATALATETGPGPQELIAGSHLSGLYGTIPAEEFITGDVLAEQIGLTTGTTQNSTVDWLKFNLDGKTLFVPEKTFRNRVSWDHINVRGAVYGDTMIEIQGDTYKVRLLKGATSVPTPDIYGHDLEQSWGSEWNRLFYPLVPSPVGTPTHPVSQEGIRYGEWADYTEEELNMGPNGGNGRITWCQEASGTNRVHRGFSGLSYFGLNVSFTTSEYYGWRPVLELVQPEDLFLGEVPSSELINGVELASKIGLITGTPQHNDEPWLCFKLRDGKIIYVAKKPFKYNLSWNHINARGAVFGTTEVTIKGRRFKVRLLKGANEDPTDATTGFNPTGTDDSEWNRLMYNIHNGEHTDPEETTPPGFWPLYSDLDLGIGAVSGNGRSSWCQEARATNRVHRGLSGLSYLNLSTSSGATSSYGWRPVLELID